MRQNVFACLTCHPPPANPSDDDAWTPAGVCYSCSIQCHGEHDLVEIFQKRNFTCDCGTTRFTKDQPCTLRVNPKTNTKGDVHSEEADPGNKYNQNFRNRFCSCSVDYSPQEQKGTMFQCLGLGTHETGGCGEDWYHPGCLMGLGPKWYEKMEARKPVAAPPAANGSLSSISEDATAPAGADGTDQPPSTGADDEDDNDAPLPDGFPAEDDFEHFICYKCVESQPWIKAYTGTAGFLAPVYLNTEDGASSPKKRKLDDADDDSQQWKRVKTEGHDDGSVQVPPSLTAHVQSTASAVLAGEGEEGVKEERREEGTQTATTQEMTCKFASLPPAPSGRFSLFVTEGFRERFCRCPSCFPGLKSHPQLLEEEDVYEPPLSEAGSDNGSTHGSGSLYDRGESALRNVDRVRAIEGVMAYNTLKDKLKPFFQQFAESGQAISAEDIKEYFAKLRGDEQPASDAGEAATSDHRQEQDGY